MKPVKSRPMRGPRAMEKREDGVRVDTVCLHQFACTRWQVACIRLLAPGCLHQVLLIWYVLIVVQSSKRCSHRPRETGILMSYIEWRQYRIWNIKYRNFCVCNSVPFNSKKFMCFLRTFKFLCHNSHVRA